jgi:hypothetical protein
MHVLFAQQHTAMNTGRYLDDDGRRKTGWMRAEAAGDQDPGDNRSSPGRLHFVILLRRQIRQRHLFKPR